MRPKKMDELSDLTLTAFKGFLSPFDDGRGVSPGGGEIVTMENRMRIMMLKLQD